jgi:hypothetical protein
MPIRFSQRYRFLTDPGICEAAVSSSNLIFKAGSHLGTTNGSRLRPRLGPRKRSLLRLVLPRFGHRKSGNLFRGVAAGRRPLLPGAPSRSFRSGCFGMAVWCGQIILQAGLRQPIIASRHLVVLRATLIPVDRRSVLLRVFSSVTRSHRVSVAFSKKLSESRFFQRKVGQSLRGSSVFLSRCFGEFERASHPKTGRSEPPRHRSSFTSVFGNRYALGSTRREVNEILRTQRVPLCG